MALKKALTPLARCSAPSPACGGRLGWGRFSAVVIHPSRPVQWCISDVGCHDSGVLPLAPTPTLPRRRGRGPACVAGRFFAPSPACGGRLGWGRFSEVAFHPSQSVQWCISDVGCHGSGFFRLPPPQPSPAGGGGGQCVCRREVFAPSPACGGRLGWGRFSAIVIHPSQSLQWCISDVGCHGSGSFRSPPPQPSPAGGGGGQCACRREVFAPSPARGGGGYVRCAERARRSMMLSSGPVIAVVTSAMITSTANRRSPIRPIS